VTAAFFCGTTCECSSLTIDERLAVARRWSEVVQGTELDLIVHVGSNCQQDAVVLAKAAEQIGAQGIAALTPCYFKPANEEDLVTFMEPVAAAAPETPFYFYDIPSMTGVALSMVRFLDLAGPRIPNLAGLKYTNGDAVQLQECLRFEGGKYDILYGFDESLLSGLSLGTKGAVGSSYNFAAPVYHRVIDAFEQGDLETARREQADSIRLIRLLASYGYMAAAKTVMELLGVPVGSPRSPIRGLSVESKKSLEQKLHEQGLWEKIQPGVKV